MEQRDYSLIRLVKLTDCKSDKGKERQRDKRKKKVLVVQSCPTPQTHGL